MTEHSDPPILGRVVGLWRYPVKSMGAEALDEAPVSWHGIAGDRRWAFVRDNMVSSGFPWLTLRERGDMNRYIPSLSDPDKPDSSPTTIKTPSGEVFDITDPALSAELYPQGAQLIRQGRGVFDMFPLSLITTQTVARLSKMVGEPLDVQRFRPNILVEAADDTPFQEDTWVGRELSIGNTRVRIDKRDGRCAVITIDPATAERNPSILRTVATEREGCLGVYGTTVSPGSIAIDDAVRIDTPR